jgi:hypothetical protein
MADDSDISDDDNVHSHGSVCEKLRMLVPDCMSKHLYKGAIFFAGKLCSMSGYRPEDVFLLAQVQTLNSFQMVKCRQ